MTLSENVMRHLHRASLQASTPKIDILTWAYLLSGFDIGFVRVSAYNHIHDKMYGEKNDVTQYLNRLHIGLFGMRASFAKHLGFEGNPLDLSKPQIAIKYFAIHLKAQSPQVRNDQRAIDWVAQGCLMPKGLDHIQFAEERAKVARMQVIVSA